ncbi:MAG TPA: hypothetical protein VFW96_09285 [Thermomicrobiales bacterium]|nr:hypothetical protein [Thermomicrobiales bacterium]
MAAATPVVLGADARRELDALARRERVTVSRAAAELVCRGLGVDPGPRPVRTLARDGVPEVVALAAERGGVSADEARAALGVGDSTARRLLALAHDGGLVARRRGAPRRGTQGGNKPPTVYVATNLGRRLVTGDA